jgi:hypothetical protein
MTACLNFYTLTHLFKIFTLKFDVHLPLYRDMYVVFSKYTAERVVLRG